MNRLYCLGEAVYDLVFKASEAEIVGGEEKKLCFELGEKIKVSKFKTSLGGSALNICVGASRLGIEVMPIFSVGVDDQGRKIKELLKSQEINDSLVVQGKKYATKISAILAAPNGDRTILVYHGKGSIGITDINWDSIESEAWFYLGPLPENTEKLIDKVLQVAQEKKLKLIVNPGTIQVAWGQEKNLNAIKLSELYVLNKNEADDMFGEGDEEEVLGQIKSIGAKRVIITKGVEGSIASDKEKIIKNNIIKVDTLDATGAGDGFLSGVIGGILNEKTFEESLKWGMINSSSVVRHFGAQDGLMSLDKITRQ